MYSGHPFWLVFRGAQMDTNRFSPKWMGQEKAPNCLFTTQMSCPKAFKAQGGFPVLRAITSSLPSPEIRQATTMVNAQMGWNRFTTRTPFWGSKGVGVKIGPKMAAFLLVPKKGTLQKSTKSQVEKPYTLALMP